jgi:hypothetical protein
MTCELAVLPLLAVELDTTSGVALTNSSVPPVSPCPAVSGENCPTNKDKICELAVLRAVGVELSPTEEIAADRTEARNPPVERDGVSGRAGESPARRSRFVMVALAGAAAAFTGAARTERLTGRAEPAVPGSRGGALAGKVVCPLKLSPVVTELMRPPEACSPWLDGSARGEAAGWPGPEAVAAGLHVAGDARGAWNTGVPSPKLRTLGAFPGKTVVSN